MADGSSGGVFLITCLLIILFVVALSRRAAQQALNDAQEKYHKHLEQLKHDPANADLYQRTLLAGRAYSNLTRQRKGVTVYDELALSNDLNAARASVIQIAKPTAQAPISTADRIRQLDGLKSQGMVTNQEYTDKRADILKSV